LPLVDLRLALALALIGAILLAAVILAGTRRWRTWRGSRRAQRRAERSIAGEIEAERLLERRGYRVLARQVALEWGIACDGEDHPVELRADLLVERRGRRYVAEVKTGVSAPLLTNAATRRQLLEYCVAYEVESVLLVDVEEERVREISFPL
jgi:Holliday junction resolvase-like predicted endonuclease